MIDYITNETCIIFDPKYDKLLDPELNIQTQYKKIIFSNYKLSNELFEAYENDNWQKFYYTGSKFNQPLANSLNNCTALTHIQFGYCFNCHLSNSLDNCIALTHIQFGFYFNQPLDNLLDNCTSLTHISFGSRFNQPLHNSFDNCTALTHIGIGYNFNQKLELPFNIKSLSLDSNNMNYTDHLSDNIEEIELGLHFNLELDNLPSSIKKIIFDKWSKYNKKLNCLPNGLLTLQLPLYYDQQISLIPSALSKLICSENYTFIEDFTGVDVQVETF